MEGFRFSLFCRKAGDPGFEMDTVGTVQEVPRIVDDKNGLISKLALGILPDFSRNLCAACCLQGGYHGIIRYDK